MARQDLVTFLLPVDDHESLRRLAKQRSIPVSVLIRHALDLLFAQERDGQLTIGISPEKGTSDDT
jgi:hypothetical protein